MVIYALLLLACGLAAAQDAPASEQTEEFVVHVPLAGLDAGTLLASWAPLLPAPIRPILLTTMCDWFFEVPSGQVLMLDILDGRVLKVADSVAAFDAAKNTPDKSEEWFQLTWIQVAARAGIRPGAGQCLGWKIHPGLGGPFAAENLVAIEIGTYMQIMAAPHVPPQPSGGP